MSQRQVKMEAMLRFHMEENDALKKRLLVSYDNEFTLTELNKQLTAEVEAYKAEIESLKGEMRETAERTE